MDEGTLVFRLLLAAAVSQVAVGVGLSHGELVWGLTTAGNVSLAAAVGVTCATGHWTLTLFTSPSRSRFRPWRRAMPTEA